MKNNCVKCGTHKNKTKHHIIPQCYTRHFVEYGFTNNTISLCRKCHNVYEEKALRIKKQLVKLCFTPERLMAIELIKDIDQFDDNRRKKTKRSDEDIFEEKWKCLKELVPGISITETCGFDRRHEEQEAVYKYFKIVGFDVLIEIWKDSIEEFLEDCVPVINLKTLNSRTPQKPKKRHALPYEPKLKEYFYNDV